MQVQGVNTFQTGIYRLNKTSLLEGNAVRDSDGTMLDDPVHNADVLRESASRRFETGGAANFLVGGALRESLVAAVKAVSARDVMKDHDAVARTECRDLLADCGDLARGFV